MRAGSVILALAAGSACVSVRPVASPEHFIPAQQPNLVWVTTTHEEVIPVADPMVHNAAIRGTWLGLGDSISVPLTSTRLVQARQKDGGRTALLVAGVALAAGIVVWRATANSGSGDVCYGEPYGTPACYPTGP